MRTLLMTAAVMGLSIATAQALTPQTGDFLLVTRWDNVNIYQEVTVVLTRGGDVLHTFASEPGYAVAPRYAAGFAPNGETWVVTDGQIRIFDRMLNVRETIGRRDPARRAGSIVFDRVGNAYLSEPSAHRIVKLNAAGDVVRVYATPGEFPDQMDLAADQCTLLYGGLSIKRLDVCTGTSLPDIPTPAGTIRGLRLLPDGTILIGQFDAVYRLDSSGNVKMKYVVPGRADWMIALDPSATTLWVASTFQQVGLGYSWVPALYALDIATGAKTHGPTYPAGHPQDKSSFESFSLFGEWRAATGSAAIPALSSWVLALLAAVLMAIAVHSS